MNKYLASLLFAFLIPSLQHAQQASISPYSAFGIGNLVFVTDPTTLAMGGTNVTHQSVERNQFNFINPAASSNLEVTSFELKLNNDFSIYQEGSNSQNAHGAYISGIDLGIPIDDKTKVALALQPFSAVGYDISTTSVNSSMASQENIFIGSGSLNDFQFAISRKMGENISVGGSVSYLFGKIIQSQDVQVENVQLNTLYRDEINLTGARFSLGMHYKKPIKKDNYFSLASRVGFGTKITSENNSLVTTFSRLSDTEVLFNVDTLSYQTTTLAKSFPVSMSFGGEIGEEDSWRIAAQLNFENGNNFSFSNNLNTKPLAQTKDSYGLAVGGYWVPNKNSYNNYFNRISYRSGVYYRNMAVLIDNKAIDNYGLTFGLGMPLGKENQSKSKINLSLDLGQRAPRVSTALKETYANFGLGLLFSSKWFVRKKIE